MRRIGVELTGENHRILYVPEGFATGIKPLSTGRRPSARVSEPYFPGAEGGVRWDDPAFGVEWPPADRRIISPKDQAWPDFAAAAIVT